MFRILMVVCWVGMTSALSLSAMTYTVAKNGSAQFSTIQEAVDAAGMNDVIKIADESVYNEMVTIDSTKSGLQLYGAADGQLSRPVISCRDTLHVHPRNKEEASDPETVDYYMNGALRIIGAQNVRVEGVDIDGSEPIVFGGEQVWEAASQTWPLQHGNAALCIVQSGNTIIRHCTIRNAFFGIYVFDHNPNGIYAIPIVADGPAQNISDREPLSVGNHCIEYNRIHDNSFAIMFENSIDMGSTVRYNLFYENHHYSDRFARTVKEFTSEGANLPGGVFYFKNGLLSPLAIYNNTFWHNRAVFVGGWKAGGQHLIFNNIYSTPNKYYGDEPSFPTHLDMMKAFENRMHNCVVAAQQQMPTASYISITNDFSLPSAEGEVTTKPFPAEGEIRYLETPFVSTDPDDPNFLVPDWTDEKVSGFIVDQGWEYSGVKDPDGTRSDIGAVCLGGGENSPAALIRPVAPVAVVGGNAELAFFVGPSPYDSGAVMTEAKATLFGVVRDLDTSDVFGSSYTPVPVTNIQALAPESFPVVSGRVNRLQIPLTKSLQEYAFFEIIVEGKNASAQQYTTAVGFIPYRKYNVHLRVELLDATSGEVVTQARVGDSLTLNIAFIEDVTGETSETSLRKIYITTLSGQGVTTLSGEPLEHIESQERDGFEGAVSIDCKLTAVPKTINDNIIVYGTGSPDPFQSGFWYKGCSENIQIFNEISPVLHTSKDVARAAHRYRVEHFDCGGRLIARRDNVGNRYVARLLCAGVKRSAGVSIYRVTDLTTGKAEMKRLVHIGSEGFRKVSALSP